MTSEIINYLGPNSYPAIVSEIYQKLSAAKSESLQSNELIAKTLFQLNESITPMLDLKEFTTNAEVLAKHDATLKDILSFITKNIKSGDLNFLVNMAKEEHFKNLSRTGFPDVRATIEDIKGSFNEPASVIEQTIKNGIFDKLESNLMMDLKSSLVDDGENKIIVPETQINESQVLLNGNLIAYNPIGLKMEDPKNNRMLLLTESDVLSFDRESKDFERISNQEILDLEIPDGHKKMMTAIQELVYNPEENSFSLSDAWDFGLTIDANGKLTISKDGKSAEIDKNDLSGLLLESIQSYVAYTPNIDRNKFLREADNMILLVENHSKLIKIDNLKVIRNLNESSNYVILQPDSQKQPKLISGKNQQTSQLFESYIDLTNVCTNLLGQKLTGLFESQIKIEEQFLNEKNQNISDLIEEQNQLNESIREVDDLMKIAEENSPAWKRLDESKQDLIEKLDVNLINLNNYKTGKLY